ncbi:MAG: helix-turn-helix domain-containing protein [Vagococcus salmoninarum]|uniref:helix-turn-helix domain-containing protein n=1 Tax=Vagococcus salmoninarum TaxID=2739 RepID=UPI003F972447
MGNRIGELRREKGLTLKRMGELLEVKDNTLSQYETGKREPQLGFMLEMAEFFDVSLEYLMGKTNKRDYPIATNEDAISLFQKIHSKEIFYDDLSKTTSYELVQWLSDNAHYLNEKYPELYQDAVFLMRHLESEYKILKWYSDMRKSNNMKINTIVDLLEDEESYHGASPEHILEFMKQSERIDYNAIEKVLEYMKNLPDSEDY